MGDYENILYETDDDRIATITLNRPSQMNAISPDLERELHEALDEAAADDAVRCIILTGTGRAFSAGYDLGRERAGINTRSAALQQWMPTDMAHADNVMHVMELDKPVIAAVNGWALGGGFWYTLACDITIASEQAAFGQPEVRMVSNTSFLFPALVGWKVAARYALTGDHFGPDEALRIGAINEVVPHDELMMRARQMAKRLAMVPSDYSRTASSMAPPPMPPTVEPSLRTSILPPRVRPWSCCSPRSMTVVTATASPPESASLMISTICARTSLTASLLLVRPPGCGTALCAAPRSGVSPARGAATGPHGSRPAAPGTAYTLKSTSMTSPSSIT